MDTARIGRCAIRMLLAVAMLAVAVGTQVHAAVSPKNLLTNSDFQASPLGPFPIGDLMVTDPATQNKWLTQGQWDCVLSGTSQYAQHILANPGNGTTDILFQMVPLTGTCIGKGWRLKLSFNYVNENFPQEVSHPMAQVYGFGPTGNWSQFAPWPATDATQQFFTTLDNTPSSSFVSYSAQFPLTGNFDAVAVGFVFGFQGAATTQRLEALDNVVLQPQAPATVTIDPRTLNLKSQGNWITAVIRNLPSCLKLSDLVPSTVQITMIKNTPILSPLPAVGPSSVSKNGVMVKFDRQALGNLLRNGGFLGNVTLTVEGLLKDGTGFFATSTIKVTNPKK